MSNLGAKTWIIIGGGILGVVILLLIFVDSSVLTDKEATLLTPKVAAQTAPVGSIVPVQDAPLDRVKVYVDRTLSMRPFTAPKQSPYFDLFRELDGLLAGSIRFFGFGYPSEERGQVVRAIDPVRLEASPQYTFVNNDYGALFSGLDTSGTHLIVSDGVQSDADTGPRFGRIVSSIGEWIRKGGVFALMAYRAPYRGTYYHEVPSAGQVEYNCDDRPFYVFGFFPAVTAKKELLGILENGEVSPQYVLTIGEESASIIARENSVPDDPNVRSGPPVLTSFSAHSDAGPNIDHVYSGRPTKTGGSGTPLHFEVQFDSTAAPWKDLSKDEMERIAQSLDPSFRHWRIDTLSVPNERVALTALSAPRIHDIKLHPDADRWTAHLTAPMAYAPGTQTRIASLLTLGVSPAGANAIIPDAYSTRRDDQPSKCSRTLNLQRTIGAVLREHYVLGRALLVTEWP